MENVDVKKIGDRYVAEMGDETHRHRAIFNRFPTAREIAVLNGDDTDAEFRENSANVNKEWELVGYLMGIQTDCTHTVLLNGEIHSTINVHGICTVCGAKFKRRKNFLRELMEECSRKNENE